MRVFLPDERKVAAEPTNNSSPSSSNSSSSLSPKSSSSLSPKEKSNQDQFLAFHGEEECKVGGGGLKEEEEEEEESSLERPNKRLKSHSSSMGGGGRLLGGPISESAESALKSSSIGGGDANNNEQQQQQQPHQRQGGGRGNNNVMEGLDQDDDELLLLNRHDDNNDRHHHEVGNNSSPHAAVAAAASSPHRSTINATSTIQRGRSNSGVMNPEDDDEIWQDNEESKSSSSHQYIFLGKSTDHNRQNIMNDDYTNKLTRRYKSNNRSSPSMLSSAAARGPTPLPNGPIPGSLDDPATMSKLSYNISISREGADEDEDPIISQFIHLLRTKHAPPLEMVEMDGDGNCLFRAISLQVYGDANMHLEVRRHCLDFMEREADHFRSFVADEEFDEYIARKRLNGVHGNHTEIQAMSELYNRSIEVFVPNNGVEPINIFHSEYKNVDAPIRLAYVGGEHYNAIIDPLVPTAGLGLGLPGLQPGLADKLQLDEAKKISDESAMEEKMRLAVEESNRASKEREEIELKEALRKSASTTTTSNPVDSDDDVYKKKAMYLSELDAADFDLEQAVLASSLESYRISQERKPSSSRRGEGRRGRFNTSPRSQRSSSNSPVYRSSNSPMYRPSSHAASSSAAAAPYSNQYAAAAASSSSSVAASAAAAASGGDTGGNSASLTTDEYPASVQELVMNGFELQKVLHAYDLIGDNFDDLLSFLLSSAT